MSTMLLMAPCKLSPERKVLGSTTREGPGSEGLGDESVLSWVTCGGVTGWIVDSVGWGSSTAGGFGSDATPGVDSDTISGVTGGTGIGFG